MPNIILSTKLHIPPLRPDLIPRPHLIGRLAAGMTYPLTLIAAPAGFGKSTLLSEWLHQTNDELGMTLTPVPEDSADVNDEPSIPLIHRSRVAWLSLDKDDNDPVRFLIYCVAALETVSPALGADVLALLQSPQPPPLQVVLPILINNLNKLPHHLTLVLDDYHLITISAIHELLIFLLDHLPPQLRLIITSRTDPPLPLARLRARNQLYELRAHDLRFTVVETATFLQQVMGLALPAEAVAVLEQRTEGWIAGLQLAALSMQGRDDLASFIQTFSGSYAYIMDYLAEEVLNSQPDYIRDFLLQTSVLDRMCGSLCDAVIQLNGDHSKAQPNDPNGIVNGQAMLEQLERAHLFLISLDDERRWYRYHHLFAHLLRNRLAISTY